MLNCFLTFCSIYFTVLATSLTAVHAQNLLVNGDFESQENLSFGNNIGIVTAWSVTSEYNAHALSGQANVVRVDGPGGASGHTPESDATGGSTPRHYLEATGDAFVWQHFVAPCSGEVRIEISFSVRRADTNFARISVEPLVGPVLDLSSSNAASPWSSVANLLAEQSFTNFSFGFHNNGNRWAEYSASKQVQVGQTYTLMVDLDQDTNMDNASVEMVGGCSPPPANLDVDEASINKTCEAPFAGVHNGEQGYFWHCSIEVNTQPNPFDGTLTVIDSPHQNYGNTSGEVLSTSSLEAGISCSATQSCVVDGQVFDGSGIINVQNFMQLTGPIDADLGAYAMRNCASGSYTPSSGDVETIDGNCVTAITEPPELSVSKMCSPLEAGATEPYTLNCQLTVTGSNLPDDSFAAIFDGFLPVTGSANVIGSMLGDATNISSNEPWSCLDGFNGGDLSMCELSAADLLAAGGTSIINTSFQFEVGPDTPQVANCAIEIISPTSILGQLNERSAGPKSTQQVPDFCVTIDIPQEKIESVKLGKTCRAPVQGTHNGAQGYFWNCQIETRIEPSTFNGTYTLQEDASNISIGQAQFVSASTQCNGIGSDMLTCEIDGNTMPYPHFVDVQLFTDASDAIADGEFIKWQNCVSGIAETGAVSVESEKVCAVTTIKPEITPPPKEIAVSKACAREPKLVTLNGVEGLSWDCSIKVTATPVPFAGSFTFTEDPSNISGTSNAQIVGITHQNTNWSCLPNNLPAPQQQCTISGNNFNTSGVELLDVELFAPIGKEPIEWRNCVSGFYSGTNGKQEVKGNCETVSWKPDTVKPPELSVSKACVGPESSGGNNRYTCTISVSNFGGPVTNSLTVDELFASTSGVPATNYLTQLTGTNGWNCGSAPYASGANCTISAADFNTHTSHQITGIFDLSDGVLKERDFENCAALNSKGKPVAEASCVPIEEPETTFDIVKSCKENGKRQEFSPGNWVQDYSCTLTVTTNGVPFTGPLLLTDLVSYGPHSGNPLVGQLVSNDPWQCATPPYAAQGAGTAPVCFIQGNDFPHNTGSTTVTVPMTVQGNLADQFGAENCGNLYTTIPTDGSEPVPVAQSCVPIVDPQINTKPELKVNKVCSPSKQTGNGNWTVKCNVTVSGTNLPAGHQIRLTDELTATSLNNVTSGGFNHGPFVGNNCGGVGIANGVGNACNITTDDIINNNGSISFPYTGSFSGVGGTQFPNKDPQNCAFASIPSLGLNAPANGKACVKIPLKNSFVGTKPVLPNIGTPPGPATPSLPLKVRTAGQCTINGDQQTYSCPFNTEIPNPNSNPYNAPLVVIGDYGTGGIRATKLSGAGWQLAQYDNIGIAGVHPNLSLVPGQSSIIRSLIAVRGQRRGGQFEYCAHVGTPADSKWATMLAQQIMNSRGIRVDVDGRIGPQTRRGLRRLQQELGMQPTGVLDDALFKRLGLSQYVAGSQSCAVAQLPPMPAKPKPEPKPDLTTPKPTLQCNPETTVKRGNSCQCKFKRMVQTSANSCGCARGHKFIAGKGCFKPKPIPKPNPELQCDARTTVKRGNSCQCKFKRMVQTSANSCGCARGHKFIEGKGCFKPKPKPKPTPKPALKCDPNSTAAKGGKCICLDRKARKISETQCQCPKGTKMRKGKCLTVSRPSKDKVIKGILKRALPKQ